MGHLPKECIGYNNSQRTYDDISISAIVYNWFSPVAPKSAPALSMAAVAMLLVPGYKLNSARPLELFNNHLTHPTLARQ